MSQAEINEIKSQLIEWIINLSDTKSILKLQKKMEKQSGGKEDWDTLPEDLKKSILQGLKESKKGNMIPSEEMWKRLNNA